MTRLSTLVAVAFAAVGCEAVTGGSTYELERQRIDRSNHDFFPVSSGAHRGMDCNDCHGEFDTFTRFTCMSCKSHDQPTVDAVHSTIAGYTFAAESCYACHPTGEGMSRAAHQDLFPIAAGPHAHVDCSDCHTPTGFSCIGCHEQVHTCTRMDEKHREVGGYACEDQRCLECHPQGRSGED